LESTAFHGLIRTARASSSTVRPVSVIIDFFPACSTRDKVTSTPFAATYCPPDDGNFRLAAKEMRAVAYKTRPARKSPSFWLLPAACAIWSSRSLGVDGGKLLNSGSTAPHGAVVMCSQPDFEPVMTRRTQLFAREVAGGIPAAAVHHWQDDAVRSLAGHFAKSLSC
jgi:hypothetical protein